MKASLPGGEYTINHPADIKNKSVVIKDDVSTLNVEYANGITLSLSMKGESIHIECNASVEVDLEKRNISLHF